MRKFALKSDGQRGAATLLFLLLASLALMASTAAVVYTVKSAQKLQYAEHAATQAQITAWNGVNLISQALTQQATAIKAQGGNIQTLATALVANQSVTFSGVSGIAAKYLGTDPNGFLLFNVTGTSAGASSTLHVAYKVGATQVGPGQLGNSITFTGNTNIGGAVNYVGSSNESIWINVNNGSIHLTGASTTGIAGVCSTTQPQVSGLTVQTKVSNQCANSVNLNPADLKSYANIVFDVNSSGQPVFSVNNVNDYSATNLPLSSLPAWFCTYSSQSSSNTCPSYSAGVWSINSSIILPGSQPLVLWFNGSLNIGGNTTILASLISTGPASVGQHATVAGFNYIPIYYQENNIVPSQNPCAGEHHPTNLCSDGAIDNPPAPVGNISILAGGDITMTGGPSLFGAVMATGILKDTGGGGSNDSIYGPIYTAGYDSGTNSVKGGLNVHGTNASQGLTVVPVIVYAIPNNNIVWASPI